jgi:hypothetical protein
MQRGHLDDLVAFVAVARDRSFTRAAAKLGVSQSALSHTIRGLEARLGVRLLTRTTRSVAPTEAGERLMRTLAPRLDEIEAELVSVAELREKPAGTIRITATEFAIDSVLLPKLAPLLRQYPDIKVEAIVDYGLTDIVAQQYLLTRLCTAGSDAAGLNAGADVRVGQYLNRDKAKLGLAARAIRENFEFDLEREEARTRDRVQDLRDKLMDQAVDSLLGRILPLRSYTPSEKNDQPFIMRLEYLEDKIDRVDDQIRRISPEFLKRRLDTTIDIDAAQGLFTQMRLSFHTISFHMGLLRSVLPLRGSLFIHERSTRPPRNS